MPETLTTQELYVAVLALVVGNNAMKFGIMALKERYDRKNGNHRREMACSYNPKLQDRVDEIYKTTSEHKRLVLDKLAEGKFVCAWTPKEALQVREAMRRVERRCDSTDHGV